MFISRFNLSYFLAALVLEARKPKKNYNTIRYGLLLRITLNELDRVNDRYIIVVQVALKNKESQVTSFK